MAGQWGAPPLGCAVVLAATAQFVTAVVCFAGFGLRTATLPGTNAREVSAPNLDLRSLLARRVQRHAPGPPAHPRSSC